MELWNLSSASCKHFNLSRLNCCLVFLLKFLRHFIWCLIALLNQTSWVLCIAVLVLGTNKSMAPKIVFLIANHDSSKWSLCINGLEVSTERECTKCSTLVNTRSSIFPCICVGLSTNWFMFKSKTCSQNWLEIVVPPDNVSQLMLGRLKSPTTIMGRQVSDKLDNCLQQLLT